MADSVLTEGEERERLFRRAIAISAGAHVLLLLMALVSPFPRSRSAALPGVMSVNLVAAAPSASAPAAAKKAAPPPPKPKAKPVEPKPAVPPPPPPKPEVKADKKLLPKESVQPPRPPKPKPAVAPPEPKKKEEPLDYADALDSLRDELGEEASDAPDPELLASVKPSERPGPPGGGGGGGDPLDPEFAAWMRRVKIHVTRAWVIEPGFKRQMIQATVKVTLDATGNVLDVDIEDGSGNPYYDSGVVRAVEKASPLPPPPESGDYEILFTPQDIL